MEVPAPSGLFNPKPDLCQCYAGVRHFTSCAPMFQQAAVGTICLLAGQQLNSALKLIFFVQI